MVHGLDDVFAAGLIFTVAALALVARFVRTPPARAAASAPAAVCDEDAAELVAEAEEWLA